MWRQPGHERFAATVFLCLEALAKWALSLPGLDPAIAGDLGGVREPEERAPEVVKVWSIGAARPDVVCASRLGSMGGSCENMATAATGG